MKGVSGQGVGGTIYSMAALVWIIKIIETIFPHLRLHVRTVVDEVFGKTPRLRGPPIVLLKEQDGVF
jgi:hypothetical protein